MRQIYPFFIALLPNFSSAQNNVPIIVVPEYKIPHYQSESDKKYQKSKEIIEDPASGNINQENVQTNTVPGSSASAKSISDIADRITSAQVEHFGGEAGALRLRLRGSRAFEPDYYFNGLPLNGVGSSEQNISILPISNIGELQIYPDSPPFWLSSMGISGDIDIQSCRRKYCFKYDEETGSNALKVTESLGSFGFHQSTSSYSLKLKKLNEIYATAEITSSKENYLVFNNNNSSLNSDVGYNEPLQNNDFKKNGGSIGVRSFYEPVGKTNFDIAFGFQDKGIPGTVGSISNARLKRNILLGTLRTEKLFAKNGLQWSNQIGALYNSSQIQNYSEGFAAQANQSENYTLQAKTWFVLPTEILINEQLGLSLEILQAHQNTNTTVPASESSDYNSNVSANRTDFRSSFFESIVFPINQQFSVSCNVNVWASLSEANSNMACNYPSAQGNCNSQYQDQEKPIYGYTFSLQSNFGYFIQFIRYSMSMRRPYLSELYGAPGGVLPNVQLLSESSKKIETGIRMPWGEIIYFHANDSNLIFLQQTSPISSQYQNIENGYRNGVFINSDYYLLRHWKISFSYQYLIAKMIQNGEETDVPLSARHYINTATNIEDILLGEFFEIQSKLGAYANMNWQSPFYLDTANINEIDVPPIYNAGISFSFTNHKRSQNYIISLDVYNILNETYATVSNTTGFIQQMQSNGYIGYPPPGRRFYISLIGEI
jgi:outer membrane receptor protein involved in Fe transport